jgi:hypothetical protein
LPGVAGPSRPEWRVCWTHHRAVVVRSQGVGRRLGWGCGRGAGGRCRRVIAPATERNRSTATRTYIASGADACGGTAKPHQLRQVDAVGPQASATVRTFCYDAAGNTTSRTMTPTPCTGERARHCVLGSPSFPLAAAPDWFGFCNGSTRHPPQPERESAYHRSTSRIRRHRQTAT